MCEHHDHRTRDAPAIERFIEWYLPKTSELVGVANLATRCSAAAQHQVNEVDFVVYDEAGGRCFLPCNCNGSARGEDSGIYLCLQESFRTHRDWLQHWLHPSQGEIRFVKMTECLFVKWKFCKKTLDRTDRTLYTPLIQQSYYIISFFQSESRLSG